MPWVQIGLALAVLSAIAWIVFLVGQRARVVERNRRALADEAEAARLRDRREERIPGGNPRHPIEVASAAVVEPRASSLPCPRCASPAHVDTHEVETHEGRRLRVVNMKCGTCSHRRPLYFFVRSSEIRRDANELN
ncbi:MAG: hypothetical protein K0V04_06820 [Deltaproteobacteria bacterium]|nr:hypothetical protein [Deltaproteobacteria bacterium]